jgi:replication factor A2
MSIDGPAKTNNIQDRVNEIIKSFENTAEGVSIDQICFKLKDLHTESEVRDTIEYLQNEGQCYTTIDNDHIKSCLP